MAAEMLAVAMLPEDSRKKFRRVFCGDTELVRHGFIHARSAPQDVFQRWTRNPLPLSEDLCSPCRHQVLLGYSNTRGQKQIPRTELCSSLKGVEFVGEGSSAERL